SGRRRDVPRADLEELHAGSAVVPPRRSRVVLAGGVPADRAARAHLPRRDLAARQREVPQPRGGGLLRRSRAGTDGGLPAERGGGPVGGRVDLRRRTGAARRSAADARGRLQTGLGGTAARRGREPVPAEGSALVV